MQRSWFGLVASCLVGQFLWAQSHPDLGNLEDFPVADEVWLASAMGDVMVNPESEIETSQLGKVDWQVPDGAEVEKDQVLALLASERITLSERDLALKKSRLKNSLLDLEISTADRRAALRASAQETGEKLLELQLTTTEKELLGSEFVERIGREKKLLEEQLERANAKLEGDYFEDGLADEKTALQLEIDNAEFGHEDLIRSSEIRAEVSGRLQIYEDEVVMRESKIGVIVQNEIAEALLEMSDPRIRNIPAELLRVSIGGEDGKVYRGGYVRTATENPLLRAVPVFVFKIEASEEGEAIPDSLNGSRMFRIHRKLSRPGHIVPKGDLLFKHPDEINEDGWAAFIGKRWEGTELLFSGPKHLVVGLSDED